MRPLLVTGTDTGVGKTVASRAILRVLANAGLRPTPLKLIETGLTAGPDGNLRPEDGAALRAAARTTLPEEWTAPMRYRLPAAPLTAARAEGTAIRFEDLVAAIGRLPSGPPLLLEGAGGLLVPITAEHTFADVATRLGARVLVVARHSLGTINHTLLTLEVARARGLEVAAVVLNRAPRGHDDLPHAEDLRPFARDVPILGPLAPLPDADDDQLAAAFLRDIADAKTITSWFA